MPGLALGDGAAGLRREPDGGPGPHQRPGDRMPGLGLRAGRREPDDGDPGHRRGPGASSRAAGGGPCLRDCLGHRAGAARGGAAGAGARRELGTIITINRMAIITINRIAIITIN